MKHYCCLKKNNFIVIQVRKILQMQISCIQKDFEIKNFGEYYDLYLKRDTIHLADAFKNVLKNISFRSCNISFRSWISMASSFIKGWSKIRINNWHWYAINGWKQDYATQFINILKLIINTWKIMIKIKNLHFLNIGM